MQLKNAFTFATACFLAAFSLAAHATGPELVAAISEQSSDAIPVSSAQNEAPPPLPEQSTETSISVAKPANNAPSEGPTSIPSPVITNAVPLATNDVWERIRNGFALPEMTAPQVRENENWYANRPDYVKRMIDRSKLYLFYIVEEVEKRGMPTEIALLPMIESAFNPKAYSRSHASGIWQFIPSTGKDFGLEQNKLYDGRRDVAAATGAALDYLQKLYGMFGNWELALAAYNWGEGSVSRAIARNRAKGEPTDYQSLSMPPETRNYVPRLIAIKNIVMNPMQFGLNLASIPNDPYFTKITTKRNMDVKLAARLADMPLDEFVSLNPAHNGPVISARGSTLLLPVDKADTFNSNLLNYSKPLVSWQTYSARKGERLDKIAKRFGTTIAALKQNNQFTLRKSRLTTNQNIIVPLHGSSDVQDFLAVNLKSAEPEIPATPDGKAMHRVKKGETLASISRQYKATTAQLKTWNHLKSNRLTLGQSLSVQRVATVDRVHRKIAAKSDKATVLRAKSEEGKRTLYTVRRGDTFFSIARKFNVAVNDIHRWNNVSNKHKLQPGKKLTVYI